MSWLHAGRVGRPHGLDGSFHVAEPTAQLLGEGRTVFAGGEEREIVRRAGTDARPIIRLAHVHDRACAASMRGVDLLCPRDQAPALEQDEWWAEDLERCQVVGGGRALGRVTRLVALPSCEALAVQSVPGATEVLIPLVADAVVRVDIDAGEIELDVKFLGADLLPAT